MASMAEIKSLRQRSGAGILDCKKALGESGGDLDAALDWLRAKGIASAAKKSGRIASEGLVEAYIHANGKIGVLLEVNCETDFVALNDGFKGFVKDLCMHIAAAGPEYVSREEVPEAAIEKERAVQRLEPRAVQPASMAAHAALPMAPGPFRMPCSRKLLLSHLAAQRCEYVITPSRVTECLCLCLSVFVCDTERTRMCVDAPIAVHLNAN